jgi:hypothetical protein
MRIQDLISEADISRTAGQATGEVGRAAGSVVGAAAGLPGEFGKGALRGWNKAMGRSTASSSSKPTPFDSIPSGELKQLLGDVVNGQKLSPTQLQQITKVYNKL